MLSRGDLVLVACSGGPDSAGLLVALTQLSEPLGIRLHAASVDHGLRASASQDVRVAERQAESLGVAFTGLRVVVPEGPSLQAQARKARYNALRQLAESIGACRIAVGHTADDQAETVLMRLLRGVGLRGLRGVLPARDDGVVRPLIDCRRDAVAALAQSRLSSIACDPSNQDPRFERVRLRQELMPLLERERPNLVTHLCDLRDEADEVVAWLTGQAAARLDTLGPGPRLALSEEDKVAPWCGQLLRLWVAREAGVELGRAHIQQLRAGLLAPAEVWLPAGFCVRADGNGALVLSRMSPK